MHLSVIICTHNPREDYLRRTLEALEKQTLPKEQWELLLIDNASNVPLAAKWDLSWHPDARHVREEELGLTPARLRGIQEAAAELLVFVDDDNVLDPDFLEKAVTIAERLPGLGCYGAGRLEPEFEEKPENALSPYTEMLALRIVDQPSWSNVPDDPWVPWGAGLCVIRSVADHYLTTVCGSKTRSMLDRKGTELNSCGDDEFSWTACGMGLGRGIFPELRVLHLIDRRRVQRDYLLRLAEGHAFSRVLLLAGHGRATPAPEPAPGWRNVLLSLASLSPSRFFYEGHRWWSERSRPAVAHEFARARNAGIKRALNYLKDQEHDG